MLKRCNHDKQCRLTMNDINNTTKKGTKMTKERREILEGVVAKAFKENKVVFERLDEI